MPRVNVEGVGQVNFPDDMSQADIIKAIETDILPSAKPAAPKQEAKAEAKKEAKPTEDFATSDAMGGDFGSSIMDAATSTPRSVMNGVKGTPDKTATLPLKPEVRRAIQNKYDAADPARRAVLEMQPGVIGDVARERAERYAKTENPALEKFNASKEARTRELIGKGEKPEFARVAAERAAEAGVAPGREIPFMQQEGVVEPSKFEFGAVKYQDASTPTRALVKAREGVTQSALGVGEFIADKLDSDYYSRRFAGAADQSRNFVKSMNENPNYLGRTVENIIDSTAQQAPTIATAVLTGGMSTPIALSAMFVQQFGQAYSEGRKDGLDSNTASQRAAWMGLAEMLGEAPGFGTQLKLIRGALKTAPLEQLKGWVINTAKKEVPGEQFTLAMQTFGDIEGVTPFGTKQTPSPEQYLQMMADTLVQTVGQSALMGGVSTAVGKGAQLYTGRKTEGEQQEVPDLENIKGPEGEVPAPPTNLELEKTRNKDIETDPITGLPLERTRNEALEVEPPAPTPVDPLAALQGARNEGIETEPPAPTPKAAEVPPIPDAEVDAKIQELTKDFMVKGFAEDDAEMLARQVVGDNRVGRVLERDVAEDEQRTVEGKADRAELQILGGDNVTAEPPSFVTQPSTDQYGDGLPSEQQLPAGGVSGPIARGLDAGRKLAGQFDSRDERERDSLEANKQRVQSQLSQAFNREAYPDLGVLLGADWTRQALSRNPTPEEYQDAAYARLEELNGERPEFAQPVKETSRVAETPKAVQAKEERQETPAAEPTAPAVVEPAPLELESTRNEAIEVEPPEVKSVAKSEAAVDKEVKKRAPGGGRKKSETAKTTEERRQQVNEINQFNRDVKTLINAATKFAQRQEFGTFATQEELDTKEEQRVNMLEQMRAELYRLAQSKNPQTGYVLAKDYIRGLKPAEVARAKTVYEARKVAVLKPQAARSTVKAEVTEQTPYEAEQQLGMEPDPIFKKFKTLKDALLHIFSSANPLEQMIAARLLQPDNLGTVNTVGFRVVEVNDKDIPSDIKAELDSDAVGYFVPTSKDNMVYVRGESYGENEQGINPEIVLHEAMHATGSKKIAFAQLAIEQGQPVEPKLASAVAELQMLMERTKAAFDALPRGERNFKLNHLNKAGAFTDIQEFYAYGLTDPTMKEFLLTKVPGTTTKTSGFDTFINILLQLFGIDPKVQSGLKDLVLASHEIMGAKAPSGKQLLSMADTALGHKAKSKKTDVDKAIAKLNASKTAEERLNALGSLSKVARDPSLWSDYIKLKWKYMNPEKLDIMLKASTTNRLYRIAKEIGVGENSINDIQKGIEEKNAFRMRTIHKVEDIVRGWVKLKGKESQRVSDLMHVSTMAQVDPSVNKSDPKLNAVWNSLSDKAKQVYIDARDFYTDHYNLYRGLLSQRIANANIAGPAKQMLMDEVRALYETGAKLAPYFPIMRYGKYWTTLGRGENKQFIMREAGQDRDFLIDEYVKEQNMKGDRRTKDQMIKDGDIKLGQDMQSLQREAMQSSEILKKLFTMVDGITATDTATKEEIKKDIFTMHLVAMPEGTFRKQFMPRQNTAGYSRDAMRNFIVMGNRFANQLSGIKYSPKIRNGVSGARASIEKNPNKARMEMFVNRIAARAEEELNPPEMDTIGEKIARTATKSAFIWQMTAIKSAVAQQFSVITHAMPVMWKHFGYGKTTAEMMRMARDAYKQVGVTSKDAKGNIIYTAPSIGSSRIVQSNPDLVRAFRALRESGVQDATRTMDLANRKKTASENYSPVISTVEALMTAPFHFGERMSREITFMSAFSLAMNKFASIPDHNARVNKSIDLALEITKEGLFDYSDANTPELMRSTPVRVAAQYRKFQVFNVEFLCRNFMEMFSNLPKEQRIGALKAFTGTLGMTALLTGIRGTFMYSVIMGTIQGMINLIRMAGDDDDELELWQTNFKKYFENVWLPEMFGEPTIGGVPLSELMLTGTIDNLTGYDISSSLSMDFWFTDESPPSDWGNFVADTLVDWGGASVGLVDTWAKGVKDAQNGDWVKAFEKWTPAMFRGLLTDVRYTQEGARAGNLQIIKEADEFTRAQLAMQALGYKTKGLAERQKDIFTYNNEKQKINAKRADIIKQIERSAELDRDDRFQAMIDKALLFNSMYPNPELAIEYEDIERAFDRRMKLLQNNIRGVTQEQKFSNLLDLQDRTEKLLDEETK
jgi:hypothetical protein